MSVVTICFVPLDPFVQFRAAICWVASDSKVVLPNPHAMQLFANAVLMVEFSDFALRIEKVDNYGKSVRALRSKKLL